VGGVGRARPAAIALGSNLGDRQQHLDWAVARLSTLLDGLRVSAVIETEPAGVGSQPSYLNACATGRFTGEAAELLAALLALERERGRTRPFPGAPRTLDLDLILLGNLVVDEPGLTVPHPRFRGRPFVLEPLASIAPDWVDPVTGLTIRALLARLNPHDSRALPPE